MTMGEVIVPVLRYTPRPGDRHSRPPHSRARRPEPRCPSYAARVTVSGTNDPGGNRNGTRARREQVAWDRRVRRFRQAGDVRHAAAQYHDVGVEHVDERRQGAAETVVVPGQRGCRARVAVPSGRPLSQTELAFFTSPVWGTTVPGMPTPTVPVSSAARSSSRTSPAMASSDAA